MNDNRVKQMERIEDNIVRYTNSVKKLTEKAKARLDFLKDKGMGRENSIKNGQLKTILSQRKQYRNLKEKTLRRKDELEALELAELERMAANSVNELARPNKLTPEQQKTQKEFNKLVKQQEKISEILAGRRTQKRRRRPRLSRRKFANLSLDTDLGEGNNSGRKSCCERVGNTCLRWCGMKGGKRKTKRKRKRKNKRKTKRVKRNKRKRKTRKRKRY